MYHVVFCVSQMRNPKRGCHFIPLHFDSARQAQCVHIPQPKAATGVGFVPSMSLIHDLVVAGGCWNVVGFEEDVLTFASKVYV